MLVMSRASICSPRTFSLLYKRDFPALAPRPLLRYSLVCTNFSTLTLQLPRMSKTTSPSESQQPSPKRRKIDRRSPQFLHPYGTMASTENVDSAQLELTEVESKLRQLLLDVAAYIDQAPSSGDVTGVQVPEELVKEKIVLRWTGGWVRDKLLKVGSHDIDVAINKMTGEHFGLKMQEYLEIPGNAEKHGLVEKDDGLSPRDKTKRIAPGLHKIEANPEKSKNLETATTKIMGIDLDLVNLRKETDRKSVV